MVAKKSWMNSKRAILLFSLPSRAAISLFQLVLAIIFFFLFGLFSAQRFWTVYPMFFLQLLLFLLGRIEEQFSKLYKEQFCSILVYALWSVFSFCCGNRGFHSMIKIGIQNINVKSLKKCNTKEKFSSASASIECIYTLPPALDFNSIYILPSIYYE